MADEKYNLVLMEGTGFHRPFCRFIEAGYIHVPSDPAGGVQPVCLGHDRHHLFFGDRCMGKFYRIDTQTEETRLIYDHLNGIHSVYPIEEVPFGSPSQPTIRKTVKRRSLSQRALI